MSEYTPLGHAVVSAPKVSVCMTVYNHERFLAQAIESALFQKTDFDFEILIGEDDSRDGSRRIAMHYKENYPDRIRLFLNDRKNVVYIDGLATGRWNFLHNLHMARGKYIALLEGDDFWTDKNKLQNQVQEMDSRPELSFCFHHAAVVDSEGRFQSIFESRVQKTLVETPDLFFRWIAPTASVLFRNGLVSSVPSWYLRTLSGDHGLQLLLSSHGPGLALPGIMSAYRVHPNGLSRHCSGISYQRNWARAHHEFNKSMQYKYDSALCNRIAHDLSRTAIMNPRDNVRPFDSLRDLLISHHYKKVAGQFSLVEGLLFTLKWFKHAALTYWCILMRNNQDRLKERQ